MGEFLLRIGKWQESESSYVPSLTIVHPSHHWSREHLNSLLITLGFEVVICLIHSKLLERSLEIAVKHGLLSQICRAQIGLTLDQG